MVFSSLEFIFIFIPIFLAAYYLSTAKTKNFCLFAFSITFYAYGTIENPFYILLILLSIILNYFCGLGIERFAKYRKIIFTAGIVYDFGCLFIFKYLDFFIENINNIMHHIKITSGFSLPYAYLILPIGISFYTFQIVSYLADVYRKDIEAEKSFINLGTYIVMFPQLIAGPIVRYSDISEKLNHRHHTKNSFLCGIKLFIIGLGFKILLANRIGSLWRDVETIGYDSISTPLAWMGIIAFSLQIYFDFYGYSLMAIGLGKMMGFNLPQNFNHPYISLSMTEFWRRWHMTLGNWFKEYVYLPLDGSRNGTVRTFLNLLIVWSLTSFWHGANWNFIIWGLFIFTLIVTEKAGLKKILNRYSIIGHAYMLLVIPLSWLIFAISDLSQLAIYIGRLFGQCSEYAYALDYIKYGKMYGVLLLIGIVFCTKLPAKFYAKIENTYIIIPILAIIFALSVYCLFIGLNDPFLYFRF